ncbi:MAG: hypothetical protein COB16_18245 [Rhodobacteraceae bacterium]|nr:MAG: hypothetical protein COB16_18245 [Paracoccaceae bacterium]
MFSAAQRAITPKTLTVKALKGAGSWVSLMPWAQTWAACATCTGVVLVSVELGGTVNAGDTRLLFGN